MIIRIKYNFTTNETIYGRSKLFSTHIYIFKKQTQRQPANPRQRRFDGRRCARHSRRRKQSQRREDPPRLLSIPKARESPQTIGGSASAVRRGQEEDRQDEIRAQVQTLLVRFDEIIF
ncbi:hypothetical protein HMI54_013762, partial [Coelomomyces lativittatus]